MSGTNDNRDDFQRMLKDSDKQEWDYVLIYKLDRFSRNKYEMAIHRKRLKDNGIKILSAMENIPDSPEGILLESLLEGMNQYYSEELSQKTKRGMNETRLKGNFIGGTINYKVLMNEENYNLLVDAVLKAHNDKIKDNSSLRFAEKELQKTETALSNLIAAVEAGFFSETSKTRLIELEERKKELKLSIATEKSKEVPRITREQVENYLTFAIEQSPQTWIDLLVKRVAIKDDIIELLLEYTHNINPTPPKNGRRNKAENPERILSERGSFFMEFTFSYRLSKTGRPPLGRPNKYYKPKNKTRIVTTRIFV